MIEVAEGLRVGSQREFEGLHDFWDVSWHILLCGKYPWHAEVAGKKPNKDHPEYLWARRDTRLILNIIDADDPKFFAVSMMDEAINFAREHDRVAVICNQGKSRSATIAMLAIAPMLSSDFRTAEQEFKALYPPYAPAGGVRGFAEQHWGEYHGG